ncbi:neural proliferation differentiation and control protein 1-like [Narcine bancroftii]|uniref:neural proliferation differentiation and control protein 1-like n=1 Tax=Narcine bancroftii TaxID=1343680 RepID=UPI0038321F7F
MRMGVPWRGGRGPCGRTVHFVALLGALALQLSPAAGVCPRAMDCTIERREPCIPGFDHCGSCLPNFIEDKDGNCALKTPNDERLKSAKTQGESREIRADILFNKDVTKNAPQNPPVKVEAKKGDPKKAPAPVMDAILLTLIIVCTVAGASGLIIAGICWCRLQREVKLTQKADYVGYGITGSTAQNEKSMNGDNKLAHSAQMYHYQHQKQQMLSMEKNKDESKVPDSATESEGENEDGDFTVYECPGLAPTGEMEVKNPLFDDSSLHHQQTSS